MKISNYKKTRQQGFVLALALMLMLFVGVIVISSAQKTGTETRVAQSQAPVATHQAAAEEGLYQLRNRIDLALSGEHPGSAYCSGETIDKVCECIDDLTVSQIFSDISQPVLFRSAAQSRDVFWWFEDDKLQADLNPQDTDLCTLLAEVFVGEKSEDPGSFMTAKIDIKMNAAGTAEKKINELFGLGEDKGFSDITASELGKFYDDEYLDALDKSLFAPQKLAAGATLDPSSLSTDRINIIVLDGKLNVQLSEQLADKELIIISNKVSASEGSSGSGGKGNKDKDKGNPHGGDDLNGIHMDGKKGAGAGGISGWILAPDAGVYTPPGTPHINMNVNVNTCKTGAHTDRCFESAGGSGFNGGFGAENFKTESKSPDGSSDSGGSASSSASITEHGLQINFDY